MTIPDEAVEAAAQRVWWEFEGRPWLHATDEMKDPYLHQARLALTAAAPFIAAQTLNEAATDWTEHQRANMGKGTVQQISTWLRDRAASHRSEQ